MSARLLGGTSESDTARTTIEILRLLRRHRLRFLRRNRGEMAFTGYMFLFVAFLSVPPVVQFLGETWGSPSHSSPPWEQEPAVVVLLLVAALVAVLWSSAREAIVRGPLQLSGPVIDWVLRLPVDRSRFLVPAMARSVLFRALVGAALAPLVVALVGRTVLSLPDGLTPIGLVQIVLAGALVGALSSVIGVLVVTRGTWTLRGLRPWHATAQLLLLATVGLAWLSSLPPSVGTLILWSGPWGWLAQPVMAMAGGSWVEPWTALMLTGVATAILSGLSLRSLHLVVPADLRERAEVTSGLRSGVWMSDPSWFQAAITERQGLEGRPRFRLKPPRRALLLVAWRDLLGALRAPYPVLVAFLIASVSILVVHTGPDLRGTAATAVALAPLLGLYLAGSRLMSGARMDVADPRRARHLPPRYPLGVLALMHGMWPLLLLTVAVVATSLVLTFVGGLTETFVWTLLALPALVIGALAGTYRGLMPDHLSLGVETPLGNTAPLQMASWHLSGLLGALAVTWPTTADLSLGNRWVDLLWTVVGTVLLAWWVRGRAHRTLNG